MTHRTIPALLFFVFVLVTLLGLLRPLATAEAFEWTPTDEEIQKYRKSWNPFSEGPLLIQSVDIHPKDQLSVRPFVFSQISEKSYGNQLAFPTNAKNGPVHLYSVAPLVTVTYGITNHVELGAATSWNTFWARDSDSFNRGRGGPLTTDSGLGDLSLILKYRPIVQDPDSARPSITHYNQIVLPTGRWITGTERPPGGFAPLGRLPATRFGELGFTEGITFRKNKRPFRISGGVYYTYSAPGSDAGQTTYVGDIVNTRLAYEHFLDDQQGLALNLELATLHTLTWRADGHSINRGQRSGSTVIGIEPALQWRFSDAWVGGIGVLFTVAGQNAPESIYPNFAIQWYWSKTGKVIMR
jgi:hypothetical protein